ncbi:MAG: HD domain-containing protein [Candidatus Nanoarchaeia archaeon]|nr:HD domain-containing protein [Candidatus Nanoarchaeia archaeon]
MEINIADILRPENDIEVAVACDPEFKEGCLYGKPRPGHPEGKVVFHVRDVLDNIERWFEYDEKRANLRLIAFLHDTFKFKVDETKPRDGTNHHGYIARKFAEGHVKDLKVLEVIELHDKAYSIWCAGRKKGWDAAAGNANMLIRRLDCTNGLDLYLEFYKCDSATEGKTREHFDWFSRIAAEMKRAVQ